MELQQQVAKWGSKRRACLQAGAHIQAPQGCLLAFALVHWLQQWLAALIAVFACLFESCAVHALLGFHRRYFACPTVSRAAPVYC